MIPPEHVEAVPDFDALGVRAFTTTRLFGSVGSSTTEPVRDVMGRWDTLRADLSAHGIHRLATASQVHGRHVIAHSAGWEGWLRGNDADGHFSAAGDTALAVTVADCVPVFIAHPSGAVAVLHSGWRGTARRITEAGIAAFRDIGPAADLHVHLGPAVCGECYEVSPEVFLQLTGEAVRRPRTVDIRAIIADHALAAGVRQLTVSRWCTRHHNERFFSHRAGDSGRQLGVIHPLRRHG